jgi:hypothetical protein
MFNFDLYSRMIAIASVAACLAGCSGSPDADPTAPSVDESEAHVDSVHHGNRFPSPARCRPAPAPAPVCADGNPTIPSGDVQIGPWTDSGFPIHLDGTACPGDHLTLLVNGDSSKPFTTTAGTDGSFAFDVNYNSKAFCGQAILLEVSISSTTHLRETDVPATLPPC